MQLNFSSKYLLIYLLTFIDKLDCFTEVLRPRGVPLDKKVFYDATRDFTCLDGSASLPFVLVNDDYCDCDDGSDEPGTSACHNGFFHCSNVGFLEKIIPSSRVNDGICDCCDASDEYNSSVQCVNICVEMGERLREERDRQLRLLKEGNVIREQYVEEAKKKKEEYKSQLEDIRRQKDSIEAEKNAKESIKKAAEEKEKAALDKHKEVEDKIKSQREELDAIRTQEEDRKVAKRAFSEMDLNRDNLLSYTEVQRVIKFDKDGDGVVSEDEAKFFLYAATELDLEEYLETAWIIMKPYYLKEAPQPESDARNLESEQTQSEPLNEREVEGEPPYEPPIEDNEPVHEEEEEEEEDNSPPFIPPQDAELMEPSTDSTSEPPLEYDEETKNLVEIAKRARDEYSEIEGRYSDMTRQIRELEVNLETDYGPNSEFMALHGQCFELTDREYIYKFCPFDNASQRPKDGGTETNLGRWGSWIGPDSNKYERMKFDGGATCWNGPARSVVVSVKCGTTNEVTAASEPSRCEYALDFFTPAICTAGSQQSTDHIHSEL